MAFIDKTNPAFDALSDFAHDINFSELSFYSFSVINTESPLAQTETSGYYPMEIVDSALAPGNHRIFECGGKIKRENNLLTFDLPLFYKDAFIIAAFNANAGSGNWYNRIMFEYGETPQQIELARNAITGTGSDHRRTDIMIAHQGGRWPTSENDVNKFIIESYGTQTYFGCNIIIGVI